MAIPGKYEVAQKTMCGKCRQVQDLRIRPMEWGGGIWLPVLCSTPGCDQELVSPKQKPQRYKGGLSNRPHVPLLTLPNGDQVILDEYECSEADAVLFAEAFREIFQRIPAAARDAILGHWQADHGAPHVWLLEDRRRWGGRGWAAALPGGLSFCMVSTLVGRLPKEYVETAIAHEMAHIAFIAGDEPNHVPPPPENPFDPPPQDPLRAYRCEWLVWQTLKAWGFDQPAMEEWMERNTEEDASGIRFRDEPLTGTELKCVDERKDIEKKLKNMTYPATFEQYVRG